MFTEIFKRITKIFFSVMLMFTTLFSGGTVTANPVPEIADGADIRAVSFNLRCTGLGKTSIAYRAPLMVAQLKELDADSMGFQEANLRWMLYLEEHLDEYDYVGVARSDGNVLGECSPVFYKKDKYKAVDSGTFWLSKTPEKAGSKDWGSQNVRICSWVLLENKETGERYAHFNTHLDHISSLARENQMKVLLAKIDEFKGKYPIVLTGDFNDTNESEMYKEATAVLNDSRLLAPVTEDKITFHDYGERASLIDFMFVSDEVTPLVYHVIDDKINDVYLSDHYGIYVDMKF